MWKRNGAFRLTFPLQKVTVSRWNPQLRTHGQICYSVGELLPTGTEKSLFSIINYFIDGNEKILVNVRMGIAQGLNQNIVSEIENQLHCRSKDL